MTLLSAGLIPAEMVSPSDFSDETHRTMVEKLIAGESVTSYVEGLSDEAARARAFEALNVAHLPESKEDAMVYAEDCLSTIRQNRRDSREEQIQREIASATPEQKAALYKQMMAMMDD